MFHEPMARALVDACITHVRYEPRPYRLSHRLRYFYVPLSRLDKLERPFLGRNRFNLYSLDDRDYGRSGGDIRAWIADAFRCVGLDMPDDYDISLLTLPRSARLRLQSGELLVLPRHDGCASRGACRGQQHIRRAPLLHVPKCGWVSFQSRYGIRVRESLSCVAISRSRGLIIFAFGKPRTAFP